MSTVALAEMEGRERRPLRKPMTVKERGLGFCPEVTAKVARAKARLVEVPVSYHGRDWAADKKIRLRDGFYALWCLVKYN